MGNTWAFCCACGVKKDRTEMQRLVWIVDFFLCVVCLPVVLAIVAIERWRFRCDTGEHKFSVFLGRETLGSKDDPVEKQAVQALFCHSPLDRTYYMTPAAGARKPVFRVASNLISIHFASWSVPLVGWSKVLSWMLGDFLFLVVAARRLRRIGPSFFEVNFGPETAIWGVVFSYLTGLPMIVQVRGNVPLMAHLGQETSFREVAAFRWMLRWLWMTFVCALFYHRAALVLGYNRNNSESAVSQGCSPCILRQTRIRQFSVFEGLPNNLQEEKTELGIGSGAKLVFLWSRLEPGIAIEPAFRAMIKVLKANSDIVFVVAGDGSLRPQLEVLAQKGGVSERVHILGHQHRARIASICQVSDIALLPYGGSTIIEAASQNLPVVTFDVEWLGEVIEDGLTGYLADYPDENSMADKVLEALLDPSQAEFRAKELRKKIARVFDEDRIEARESKVISQFLSELQAG